LTSGRRVFSAAKVDTATDRQIQHGETAVYGSSQGPRQGARVIPCTPVSGVRKKPKVSMFASTVGGTGGIAGTARRTRMSESAAAHRRHPGGAGARSAADGSLPEQTGQAGNADPTILMHATPKSVENNNHRKTGPTGPFFRFFPGGYTGNSCELRMSLSVYQAGTFPAQLRKPHTTLRTSASVLHTGGRHQAARYFRDSAGRWCQRALRWCQKPRQCSRTQVVL